MKYQTVLTFFHGLVSFANLVLKNSLSEILHYSSFLSNWQPRVVLDGKSQECNANTVLTLDIACGLHSVPFSLQKLEIPVRFWAGLSLKSDCLFSFIPHMCPVSKLCPNVVEWKFSRLCSYTDFFLVHVNDVSDNIIHDIAIFSDDTTL